MSKIYRESFGYFFASLPALLAFAAMIEVLLWVLEPKGESSISFVALLFVAYAFHRHFLFGETLSVWTQKPADGAPAFKFGWFLLVSTVLILGTLGIGIALAHTLFDRPQLGVLVLIYLGTYLVTLSLFGIAIPASVARDNTFHIAQGFRTAFSTMWRLILGPGVVGFALIIVALLGAHALGQLGVTEGSLADLAFNIALRTLGFLTTIFAVAVLCEMYRKTRPGVLAKDPGQTDQRPA